jgi:pimeloyl-ACP methyl ester carboxylesterase
MINSRRTFRAVAYFGALGLFLAVAGLAYQTVSETEDLDNHHPPGQLVDIGGRRLHLLCRGPASGPSVIIEAGNGDDTYQWADVLRRVSVFARICAYDRAGIGWSDPATSNRTFDDRADDLYRLLGAANIPSPYILVGHSYGGTIVRRFAAAHPTHVAGAILVDATEEEVFFTPAALKGIHHYISNQIRLGWMTRFGLMRATAKLRTFWFHAAKDETPDAMDDETFLALRSSRHFAEADEMASFFKVPANQRTAGGLGTLGNVPLIIIFRAAHDQASGKEINREWHQGQMRLAQLSRVSTLIEARKSGHLIQLTQPAIICNAIRRLLTDLKDQHS